MSNNFDNVKRNKEIYIVLSQTQTFPSKLIKLYTKKPYAHASIAFDRNLDEMYSFARRGIWNPFNAGFIREYLNTGIFGRNVNTMCSVYRLRVTNEQYNMMKRIIEVFESDSLSYSYNYLGILGIAVNHPVTRNKKYFCSQFVAYVLKMGGVNVTDKIPALVRPDDISKYKELEMVFMGKLNEYRDYIEESAQAIV